MKVYARMVDNVVAEIITPGVFSADLPDWQEGDPSRIGTQMTIEYEYNVEFASWCIDITGVDPQPDQHWTYDGVTFSPPYVWTPGPADILAANQAYQGTLKIQASQAMTPLLISMQLDATDEITVKARAWRDYYQALEAVDLTVTEPVWPAPPAA